LPRNIATVGRGPAIGKTAFGKMVAVLPSATFLLRASMSRADVSEQELV
jgi:hypothetical protein